MDRGIQCQVWPGWCQALYTPYRVDPGGGCLVTELEGTHQSPIPHILAKPGHTEVGSMRCERKTELQH